jgi:hypothetical protein
VGDDGNVRTTGEFDIRLDTKFTPHRLTARTTKDWLSIRYIYEVKEDTLRMCYFALGEEDGTEVVAWPRDFSIDKDIEKYPILMTLTRVEEMNGAGDKPAPAGPNAELQTPRESSPGDGAASANSQDPGSASATKDAPDRSQPDIGPVSRPFEMCLAHFEAGEDRTEYAVPGSEHRVYVEKQPFASIMDVGAIRMIDDATGKPAIEVTFLPDAVKRVSDVTQQHLNKPVAILAGGKLFSAPTIREQFGSTAVITGEFSRSEAEQVSRMITTMISLCVSDPGAGPVWGEAVEGLQLAVSGIRQDRHFNSGDTIRFSLLVRNVGTEVIRFEYKPSKLCYWIAPYVENARGERVVIRQMYFRGGHKTFTEALEPNAVVSIHLVGILVLGASDTAEKDWPRIDSPVPGEYRLRAGYFLFPLDADGRVIVKRDADANRLKTINLTSGTVTFHIDDTDG